MEGCGAPRPRSHLSRGVGPEDLSDLLWFLTELNQAKRTSTQGAIAMRSLRWLLLAVVAGHASTPLLAQVPNERQREYLDFIKAQAAQLRDADKPPATRQEWEQRGRDLRGKLRQAFGTVP